MKTVYNSLTFYDSIDKTDVKRTKAVIPIHCPRHQLPPFIIGLGDDTIGTIDKIELLRDEEYNVDIATSPYNALSGGVYETFTVSGNAITSAINVSSAAYAYMDLNVSFDKYEAVGIEFTFTLNSGAAPYVYLEDNGLMTSLSSIIPSVGVNLLSFQVRTSSSTPRICFQTNGACNWSMSAIVVKRGNINSLFTTIPDVYTDGVIGDYIQYKGDVLTMPLPLGLWYLKISADGYEYISDYIMVGDIYPNLIKTFTNNGCESFYKIDTKLSINNSAGSGSVYSNNFTVVKDEKIRLITSFLLNSGTTPDISLVSAEGVVLSATYTLSAGFNDLEITATPSGTGYLQFSMAGASSWSTLFDIFLIREYSPNFCKLKFYNGSNIGHLLYVDDFYQEIWLDAVLNNPSHEMVTVGEEKNGIFIPQKITTKYTYTLIAYVSRAVYSALMRLPQHETIYITDEQGETYSPRVGNVMIEQPEWIHYDTAKVTIRFNNGSYSQYTWTN